MVQLGHTCSSESSASPRASAPTLAERPSTVFDHWDLLESDPYREGSTATRSSKDPCPQGLKPGLPVQSDLPTSFKKFLWLSRGNKNERKENNRKIIYLRFQPLFHVSPVTRVSPRSAGLGRPPLQLLNELPRRMLTRG